MTLQVLAADFAQSTVGDRDANMTDAQSYPKGVVACASSMAVGNDAVWMDVQVEQKEVLICAASMAVGNDV